VRLCGRQLVWNTSVQRYAVEVRLLHFPFWSLVIGNWSLVIGRWKKHPHK
jgi:hypothetical protein